MLRTVTAFLFAAAAVCSAGNIILDSEGLVFPLNSYHDYSGRGVKQLPDADGMTVLAFPASKKTVSAASPVLRKKLAAVKLPDWEYSDVFLPAELSPSMERASLQFIALRKNKVLRYSLVMSGVNGIKRTYTTKRLYARDKTAGPLKFSELNNMYFNCRPAKEAVIRSGALKFKLYGSTAVQQLPVADAVFIDKSPSEKDWQSCRPVKLTKGLKAPAEVRFMHNKDLIFVRFDQKTDTSKLVSKQNKDGHIWRDDSFQFLISAGNDNKSYHLFMVNPAGVGQSYHYVFDQVADTFIRTVNLRKKEWSSKTVRLPDRWSAVFTVNKSMLDKFRNESIHGLQIFVDNSASGGGMAVFSDSRRTTNVENSGVLRLVGKGKTLSRNFSAAPGLFFHKGSVLTGVPGDFEFRLSCQAGKISGAGLKCRDFAFIRKYSGTGGVQRLVIWNDDNGCIFAGKTQDVRFRKPVGYGTRVLVPEPKKVKWNNGMLKTAGLVLYHRSDAESAVVERIRKLWQGYFQTELKVQTASLPGFSISIGRAAKKLEDVKKSEGYTLDISSQGIYLCGNDAPGLSHAVTTLEQLCRYAMLRGEDFLPCVSVSDHPDIPNRMVNRWIDSNYWSPKKEFRPYADTFEEIEAEMYDSAYRFDILNKINHLALQNPNQIIYETPDGRKLNRKTSHLTLKEFRDFAGFCRRYHLGLIPAGAGASHANYLITNNFPHLILPGFGRGDADPTHPDFWKYLHAARGEVISAVKPAYFCTMNDEWWHYPTGEVNVMQNGRPRHEIFRETIEKEHRFITERGARMMMCSDMLQPGHNGGKPYDNHVNLGKLPKDIIMMNWSGGEPGVKLFTKLGYTVWGVFNLSAMGKLDPEKIGRDPLFQGIGCTAQACHSPEGGYGSQSIIATAETAWNFYTKNYTTMDDWFVEYGAAVMPMYSVYPNKYAARSFKMLALPGMKKLPSPFKSVPEVNGKVGFIPMKTAAGKGLKAGRKPQIIPVGAKASSLIFLQSTLTTAKPPIVSTRRSQWILGIKSAVYTITYADGKTVTACSRHGMNNGNAYPRRGRVTSERLNRYVHDARYVWQLKDGEKDFFLYQYEWVNPRPQVEIKHIAYSNLEDVLPMVSHYLFAVTLRDVK